MIQDLDETPHYTHPEPQYYIEQRCQIDRMPDNTKILNSLHALLAIVQRGKLSFNDWWLLVQQFDVGSAIGCALLNEYPEYRQLVGKIRDECYEDTP